MSLLNPNEIPGYAKAIAKEQTVRDLAFLDAPLPLCGIRVRQFTPRHWILLQRCGCPFLVGGPVTRDDVFMFLWFVSPEYCLDLAKRDEFLRVLCEVGKDCHPIKEIEAYLDDAFQDMPGGAGAREGMVKSYMASVTVLVDAIAAEYGWDDDAILEKPLARLFQYMRRIAQRHRPDKMLFNRSDRLIGEWRRKQMETS